MIDRELNISIRRQCALLSVARNRLDSSVSSTRVWQKWRFSAPQTHLWLIKVWFSASTLVVKIPPIANLQNVSGKALAK